MQEMIKGTILKRIEYELSHPIELKLFGSFKNALIVNDTKGIHVFDLERDNPIERKIFRFKRIWGMVFFLYDIQGTFY